MTAQPEPPLSPFEAGRRRGAELLAENPPTDEDFEWVRALLLPALSWLTEPTRKTA